jgi:hypothetical protein
MAEGEVGKEFFAHAEGASCAMGVPEERIAN